MIAGQRHDLDLPLTLIAHRAQPIGLLRVAGEFRIDQEQKAARNIHRLDDESDRDVCQSLHVEDVADLFAVGVQGAAGMVFPNVQPAVHPAAHQRKAKA